MINFTSHPSNPLSALAFFLLSIVFLQGCGAERTTPFNTPDSNCSSSSLSSSSSSSNGLFSSSSSSSSSANSSCSSNSSSSSLSSSSSSKSSKSLSSSASSSVDSLEIKKLASAKTIREAVTPSGKNVQLISTSDDFDKVIGKYLDPLTIDSVDFNEEQVILIYDGEVNSCAEHLEFNQGISAQSEDNGSVKITLHYNLIPDDTKCSPSYSNPFAIYSIKTRKPLISQDIVDAKQ